MRKDRTFAHHHVAPPNPQNPNATPGFCTLENRRYVLIAAILASALGFIDGTIVAIALPTMRAALGADFIQAQWINNGYLFSLSALILLGGALGDRFGTARAFAWGIGIFCVASALCAVAPNVETLIAGRVLKGVGAAIMIPGSLALIARAYPREDRGRAIGVWAAASALMTALGPILGGAVLSQGGADLWRWLFIVNVPFGGIALWLVLRKVAHDPARADHPLDLVGAVLITAGLGCLAWGLTTDASGANWTLVATGLLIIVAFTFWEAYTPHPMIPLTLFKTPAFSAANLATAFLYFSLSTILFFLPMTMIAGWGMAEVVASVAFVPLTVFITLLSAQAGRWSDVYGAGRLIGIGGMIVAIAFGLIAFLAHTQNFWIAVLPGTILMGFGMALVVSPLSNAVMGSVSDDKTGVASGVNNAMARIAGLIAVAVMGGLATMFYERAGGTDGFGTFSATLQHAAASTTAFASLAWITATLCAGGAVVAWVFIPKPQVIEASIDG